MKAINAELIITESLFENMISNLELKFSNKASLMNEAKYHAESLNSSLKESFDQILFVLQSTVDSFYLGYYEISGFIYFTENSMDEAIEHNSMLLRNARKLIKYIN